MKNRTIAVVYQSKYGSTKKYAEWIQEELSCDLFEKKSIKTGQLENYDVIIYGGGLYAGGVSGIDLVTKSFARLKNKKWILFTCGLADPNDISNTNHIMESLNKVLTPKMQAAIKVFHLRGGIDYSKLGIVHKTMMAMLYKMISKKEYGALREEDKQMLDTYGKCVDFTDKSAIRPIISCVNKMIDAQEL